MSLWILFSLLEQQLALAKGFGVPLQGSKLRVASLRVAIALFYFYWYHYFFICYKCCFSAKGDRSTTWFALMSVGVARHYQAIANSIS
ncbi:hypothetical protein LC605_31630 [Nostoc sp. CHAB 5836]|uniref:hypothetical protein n=1 Tax=Nostoc sp. CHAB 5836 TaxID=2780404 RepID=UPI001E2F6F31|nr:hypothetical protein [Nostoc sp. CHAB 5836]MCC5619521.1 hypothetical protein [Nostoc sp. CHAB 5836]